jgi:hypothetical protein
MLQPGYCPAAIVLSAAQNGYLEMNFATHTVIAYRLSEKWISDWLLRIHIVFPPQHGLCLNFTLRITPPPQLL